MYDADGVEIGFVSYNGRVWLNDVDGDAEVPVAGRKTCAELDKEGWQ